MDFAAGWLAGRGKLVPSGGLAKLPPAALFLLMSVRDIANLASMTHG